MAAAISPASSASRPNPVACAAIRPLEKTAVEPVAAAARPPPTAAARSSSPRLAAGRGQDRQHVLARRLDRVRRTAARRPGGARRPSPRRPSGRPSASRNPPSTRKPDRSRRRRPPRRTATRRAAAGAAPGPRCLGCWPGGQLGKLLDDAYPGLGQRLRYLRVGHRAGQRVPQPGHRARPDVGGRPGLGLGQPPQPLEPLPAGVAVALGEAVQREPAGTLEFGVRGEQRVGQPRRTSAWSSVPASRLTTSATRSANAAGSAMLSGRPYRMYRSGGGTLPALRAGSRTPARYSSRLQTTYPLTS